jgi:hypothetical protein
MSNPTSNYGWQMPTATDLVTDLPADFEVFGQAVDTALMDLKGGTTGQVLAKASSADMDFVWSADAAGMTNPMTTTGDSIYSSSGSTPARLGIGTTGQVLTVAGGLPSWATPSAGGLTLLSTTALTGSSVTVSSISQSYKNLFIYVKNVTSPAVGAVTLRLNGITTSSYTDHRIYYAAAGVQADFTTGTSLFLNNSNSNTAFSGKFAALMTIPRYTDTSLIDVDIRSSGRDATAGILVSFNLGRFDAAAAISSVTLDHTSSFSTGTMYIYGES